MAASTKIYSVFCPSLAEDSTNKSKLYSDCTVLPCSVDTTLWSSKSSLFPIKNIFISGEEFDFNSFNHRSTPSKLGWLYYIILYNKNILITLL